MKVCVASNERKTKKVFTISVSTDDWHLVLDRARKAGVEKLIITGTNLEEANEAIDVIKQHNESRSFWREEATDRAVCD